MKRPSIYTLLSSALLLSCAATIANADDFSGFYAGVAGGGSFLTGHEIKHLDLTSTSVDGFSAQAKQGISKNSFLGMAFAGYGTSCFGWENAYIGAEAFIDVANRTEDNFVQSNGSQATIGSYIHQTNLQIHPVSYGLDLRPGFKITDCTLLYARLGFGINTIRATGEVGGQFGPTVPRTALVNVTTKRNTHPVLRLGLGLEQPIYESLSLRVDYIYTYLGKFSLNDTSNGIHPQIAPTNFGSIQNNTQLNLANHAVTIGLVWHF